MAAARLLVVGVALVAVPLVVGAEGLRDQGVVAGGRPVHDQFPRHVRQVGLGVVAAGRVRVRAESFAGQVAHVEVPCAGVARDGVGRTGEQHHGARGGRAVVVLRRRGLAPGHHAVPVERGLPERTDRDERRHRCSGDREPHGGRAHPPLQDRPDRGEPTGGHRERRRQDRDPRRREEHDAEDALLAVVRGDEQRDRLRGGGEERPVRPVASHQHGHQGDGSRAPRARLPGCRTPGA